jgi:hypothetical protein
LTFSIWISFFKIWHLKPQKNFFCHFEKAIATSQKVTERRKQYQWGICFWFFCLNVEPIFKIWDFFLKNQGNSENHSKNQNQQFSFLEKWEPPNTENNPHKSKPIISYSFKSTYFITELFDLVSSGLIFRTVNSNGM